jgi:hypothetical protein
MCLWVKVYNLTTKDAEVFTKKHRDFCLYNTARVLLFHVNTNPNSK